LCAVNDSYFDEIKDAKTVNVCKYRNAWTCSSFSFKKSATIET